LRAQAAKLAAAQALTTKAKAESLIVLKQSLSEDQYRKFMEASKAWKPKKAQSQ
jgi:hypothetical protein